MSQTLWKRRECVSAEVEDALVLLDIETMAYHSLNKTAATVWQLLAEPSDSTTLVDHLCERYDIDRDSCRASVDRLMQQLAGKGLVQAAAIETAELSA